MDKRTKEYKEWKDKQSKGIGDTVEKITKATGIKAVVDLFSKLTGLDCGCDERKERWNKKFSYKINCLNEKEYNYLKQWYDSKRSSINIETRRELIKIYNRVLNRKQKDTSCATCIRDINNTLKSIYNEYEE